MSEEQETEVQEEVVEQVAGRTEEPTQQPDATLEIKNEIKLMGDRMEQMARRFEPPHHQNTDEYRDPVEVLQQEVQRQRIELAESRMMTENPDYKDVITKYLPQAIKENPRLAQELRPTDFALAYAAAKASAAYQKDKAFKPKTEQAKKIVDNTEKIGSVSGIGTATAGSSTPNFLSMTDEEFMAYKRSRENL